MAKGQFRFTTGGRFALDIVWDVCIDGTVDDGTMTVNTTLTGAAALPQPPGAIFEMEASNDRTLTRKRLDEVREARPALNGPAVNGPPADVVLAPPIEGLKTTIIGGIQADKLVGDLIWTAQADAFYALTNDGVLSRVAIRDFVVEKQVTLAPGCSFLAFSGEWLLVANKDAREVWLVDPATFELKKKIPTPRIQRVLSAPRLPFALVTCADPNGWNGEVGFLDLVQGKIISQTQKPVWHGRISPDGRNYFAQSGVEELHRFRIDGAKLTEDGTSERIAANGQNICVSSDSKLVCLPSGGGNAKGYSTFIFGVDDVRDPLLDLKSGAYPHVVGFDPAAKLIYAQNHRFGLLVFNMNGVKIKEYLPTAKTGDTRQLVAHPQGGKLLVATSKHLVFVELPADASTWLR
jgi:hypothetical protein